MKQNIGVVLFLAASACCSAQLYTISTIAGGAPLPTPAISLDQRISPEGLATDAAGNVFFTSDNCIFKLAPAGVMILVAGNARRGYSGDGGPATNAQLSAPSGLAFDAAGGLLIVDSGNLRIRRVAANGIITTVAGSGASGGAGNGGPAVSAQLNAPSGIAADQQGNFYFGDNNYSTGLGAFAMVRKVSPNGIINRVAINTAIFSVAAVAWHSSGDLLVADRSQFRVFRVSPDGSTTTFAGGGTDWPGDGGAATSARLIRPASLAVDGQGNVYVGDAGQVQQIGYLPAVRKITLSGTITTIAGGGQVYGPAPSVTLSGAAGVAVDNAGNLFIADGATILEISRGIATTVAGGGIAANSGQLELFGISGVGLLNCVAVDSAGILYISENALNRVRKVATNGTSAITVGTGVAGYSGDGGPASLAQLNGPSAIALDAAGNLYVADHGNSRIRKVSPAGIISTLLNYGGSGYQVRAMTVDRAGNLYFADEFGSVVRKLSVTGVVSAVIGPFPGTTSLASDGAGSLYLAGIGGIRKLSTAGALSTLAEKGDSVASDDAGNLFVADALNCVVRKIGTNGTNAVIAGTGRCGYSGDGGPAIAATVSTPFGITVDAQGSVYVADTANNAVRLLRPTNQSVMIGAVVGAASETPLPLSPGKIVTIYGAGLGPPVLVQANADAGGLFPTQIAGTTVTFNGIRGPVLYASAFQVAAIVPYAVPEGTAQVSVTYQGQSSVNYAAPVAASAPALFSLNQTGAGQAAAVNGDGTVNTAANPVKIGGYISLYATGEGLTLPVGVDGKLAGTPLPHPALPVRVLVGGIPAIVTYAGGAPGEVAGLMQVNLQVPTGILAGGYVDVQIIVANVSSPLGLTIAVAP